MCGMTVLYLITALPVTSLVSLYYLNQVKRKFNYMYPTHHLIINCIFAVQCTIGISQVYISPLYSLEGEHGSNTSFLGRDAFQ